MSTTQGSSLANRAIDQEDYVQNFTVNIDPTQDDDCSICLLPATENNQRTVNLHCRHPGQLYHEQCILQWLRPDENNPESDNNSCPLCRATLWTPFEQVPDAHEDDHAFGLIFANDPRRDLPEPNYPEFRLPTLSDFIEQVCTEAFESTQELLDAEDLNEEVVLRFTGIDLKDSDDHTRLSKANRMLHYHMVAESPESLPEFFHLVRRGMITSRLMEHYYGEIDPEDWLVLLADVKACRDEVRNLDGNTVSFLRGLPMSGLQIWESLIQTKLTMTYDTEIPVTKGNQIVTEYRKANEGSDPSVIRRIEYDLRDGTNEVAGYNPDIKIQILCGASHAEFRLTPTDFNTVTRLVASHDDREIDIHLKDGHQINLRY